MAYYPLMSLDWYYDEILYQERLIFKSQQILIVFTWDGFRPMQHFAGLTVDEAGSAHFDSSSAVSFIIGSLVTHWDNFLFEYLDHGCSIKPVWSICFTLEKQKTYLGLLSD